MSQESSSSAPRPRPRPRPRHRRGRGYIRNQESTANDSKEPFSLRKEARRLKNHFWLAMDHPASTWFGCVVIFAFLFVVANVSVIYWGYGGFEAYSRDIYENHSIPGKLVKLHIQINEVDRMLETEFNSMKKEFNEKMEEWDDMDWKLENLNLKSDSFDKSVDAFGTKGLLSKEDFGQFFEEFIKARIKGEIERHVADGLGMVDYALRLGGHPEPYGGEGHELCRVSADAGKRRWVATDQKL